MGRKNLTSEDGSQRECRGPLCLDDSTGQGIVKPAEEFYHSPARVTLPDGSKEVRLVPKGYCKVCSRATVKAYQENLRRELARQEAAQQQAEQAKLNQQQLDKLQELE